MKYLTFRLAHQLYAIELSVVREWLGFMPFTPTPGGDAAVVGVFNLRSQAISVLDLRIRCGLPVTRTDDTTMLVIEVSRQRVALIVDATVGLVNLTNVGIEPAESALPIDHQLATGVVTIRDERIVLLDVARAVVGSPPLPKAA